MKDVEITERADLAEIVNNAARTSRNSRLEIDLDQYQSHLDDPSLLPDQKAAIVEAIWLFVSAFVELGFGVHPAQQACGKPETTLDLTAKSESTEYKQHKKNPAEDAPSI